MQQPNNLYAKFLEERYLLGLQEISTRFLFGVFGGAILSALLYQHVQFLHLASWNIASLFLAILSYFVLKIRSSSISNPDVKALAKWEVKLWVIALLWAKLWLFLPFILPSNTPVDVIYAVLVIFILMTSTPTVGIGLFAPQYIFFFSAPFLSLAYYIYLSPLFMGWFVVIVVLSAWFVLVCYFIIFWHMHKNNLYLNIKYKIAKKTAEREKENQVQLMATVSHDIRQPFQALNLFLSAIDKEELSDNNQNLVQQLQYSTDALNGLLNHLLDLSLLESGNVNVEPSVFDIQSIIQPLAAQFDIQARRKGLQLYCDHESYWIKTDAILLKRILSNLLDNAIAYTKKGGVFVRLTEQDFELSVSIIDTGIGMNEQQRNSIFDPYYQVEKDTSVDSKHVGLGLSIVKKLSDLLGIKISVESQGNRGANFTITLDQVDTVGRSLAFEGGDTLWDLNGIPMLVIDADGNDELAFLLASWKANVMCSKSLEEAKNLLSKNPLKPKVIIFDDAFLGELIDDFYALMSASIKPIYIVLNTEKMTGEYLSFDIAQLQKPIKPIQLRTLIQRKLNKQLI